ncbi:ALF repeat-containing protein, partial [Streptomyces sp. NPDC057296]|uniref:ALF repeat-containing protein n=1 Tax=Streptomyces sp. NPDC057296 TaxID=3346089 RepID=UPI00362ADB4E
VRPGGVPVAGAGPATRPTPPVTPSRDPRSGRAPAALRGPAGDLALAATLGRKAAVGMAASQGPWAREAAQFALAGTDADVHAWIDADRAIAEDQDDRETALHVAEVSSATVGDAVHAALTSDLADAVKSFLTDGLITASAEDSRVGIASILSTKPGPAVTAAANAALDANTPQALRAFFDRDYAEAVRDDDGVATAALLTSGGMYTKAYAEVALEGPTWMRRNFITLVQHKAAQLDHDSATHIAAVRGAIAAAAKIAYKAQEDAQLASKAAAEARNAADKAKEWADKALASAKQADTYAAQADQNADDADKSAAAAQASANRAKAAAATARKAGRSANYSANRAIDSARSAMRSSYSAQASANSARQSAIAAGKDAQEAAAAATDARRIVTQKRRAEAAEAARKAAEAARRAKEEGHNPADSPTHDKTNSGGSSGDKDEWWNDAQFYADAFNWISIGSGFLAAGAAFIAPWTGPFAPAVAAAAGVLGWVSLASAGLSTLFTGIEHGFGSSEFAGSLVGTSLGLLTFGQSKWIGATLEGVASPVAKRVTQLGSDIISPITGTLSSLFG